MGLLSLLFHDPVSFALLIVPLLYSIIAHELAHGVVALWFGDDTAKRAGRLSLNPLVHLDPIGTLALFLVGFGWARPVPVNYYRLQGSRLAFSAVALAGVATNILIATLAIFLLQTLPGAGKTELGSALSVVATINIILGSFNLIPIPPLDGSRVVMALLPDELSRGFARLEPYGFFIIVFLLFTGWMYPAIDFMERLIYGFISLMLGHV
ncbi:MAG: site-2 protease family protein [Deltaproteobacteria bacterium]